MSDIAERMAMWSAWHRRQARECDREILAIGGCAFNQSADAWQPPSGRDFTADEQGAARRLMGDLP